MSKPFLKGIIILLLYFIWLIIIMPLSGFESDVKCWISWSAYIKEFGFRYVYNSGTDYVPFYQYILLLHAKLQPSVEDIVKNIHTLKVYTLFFDFLGIWVGLHWINKTFGYQNQWFEGLILLFNPALLYNTVIWNQVDSIATTLVLISCYFLYKKEFVFGMIFYVLALNMKLQAVIFLPCIILLLLNNFKFISFKTIILMVLTALITQFLIVLPFVTTNSLPIIYKVITTSVSRYPVVSMNAFNIWHILLRSKPIETSDALIFVGLSYKTWGMILFMFFSFWVLIRWLGSIIVSNFIPNKPKIISCFNYELKPQEILLALGMIPLIFFYFNTQMHERYSHPALIFIGLYAILSKDYIPYILVSVAYCLNMEAVMRFLNLNNYQTVIFNAVFVSSIYGLTILYGLFKLLAIKKQPTVLFDI